MKGRRRIRQLNSQNKTNIDNNNNINNANISNKENKQIQNHMNMIDKQEGAISKNFVLDKLKKFDKKNFIENNNNINTISEKKYTYKSSDNNTNNIINRINQINNSIKKNISNDNSKNNSNNNSFSLPKDLVVRRSVKDAVKFHENIIKNTNEEKDKSLRTSPNKDKRNSNISIKIDKKISNLIERSFSFDKNKTQPKENTDFKQNKNEKKDEHSYNKNHVKNMVEFFESNIEKWKTDQQRNSFCTNKSSFFNNRFSLKNNNSLTLDNVNNSFDNTENCDKFRSKYNSQFRYNRSNTSDGDGKTFTNKYTNRKNCDRYNNIYISSNKDICANRKNVNNMDNIEYLCNYTNGDNDKNTNQNKVNCDINLNNTNFDDNDKFNMGTNGKTNLKTIKNNINNIDSNTNNNKIDINDFKLDLPKSSINMPMEQKVPNIDQESLNMDILSVDDFKYPLLDIVCTNCFQVLTEEEVDAHSSHCSESTIKKDANARLFSLISALRSRASYTKGRLGEFLAEADEAVGEMVLNNTSIKDLVNSYNKITSRFKEEKDNDYFTDDYKIYFSLFIQRLGQLVLIKKKEMSQYGVDDNDDSLIYDLSDNEDDIPNNEEEYIAYMKEQLANIENETEKEKKELDYWKNEARILENSINLRENN